MTDAQKRLHARALRICRRYSRCETLLVRVLRELDHAKLYRAFGLRSLFQYAVQELRLSEPTAYALIAVARKSSEIPRLAHAIEAREISVSKASRTVSCLTNENADEVITFAARSTCREIDREVARRNPSAPRRTLVKPISGDSFELRLTISKGFYEKLKRAQEVAGGTCEVGALDTALDEYLVRRDPVRKAARSLARKSARVAKSSAQPRDVSSRKPLKASEKHAVIARDQGQCTHVNLRGIRCTERKWLHLHHVRPVRQGGSNDPENLVTLCSAHHDLVHQQSFPMEGGVSWLRSAEVAYGYPRSAPFIDGMGRFYKTHHSSVAHGS